MKNWHWLALGAVILVAMVLLFSKRHHPKPFALAPATRDADAANEKVDPVVETRKDSSVKVPKLKASASASQPTSPGAGATGGSKQQWQELLQHVQASIPSKKELQNLTTEEAHLAPPSIRQAGLAMGDLAEALNQNPAWIPEGIRFYEGCSLNANYPSSVRALCYSDLQSRLAQSGKTSGDFTADASVPVAIKNLAHKISR